MLRAHRVQTRLKYDGSTNTYGIDFALVVPHVYVIVQQGIVDGDASLGVDHEHARQ